MSNDPKWTSSREQLPPVDHYVLAASDDLGVDIVRVEALLPPQTVQGIWYGGGDECWSPLEEFAFFWWCEIPDYPEEQP